MLTISINEFLIDLVIWHEFFSNQVHNLRYCVGTLSHQWVNVGSAGVRRELK
jgi:hypothetical protein